MTYCAAVGIFQSFRYYNRYLTGQLELERVEKNLLEWRLNALRLHLEPHFLFNTLNAISSEVGANPELARNMIADLAALLRRSLDCRDSPEIPLAQELTLLEHYISIQRFRFGDRIEIRLDVEPAALSAMVPSMLLQPLVENAIKYGVSGTRDKVTLNIRAAEAGPGRFTIEVQNSAGTATKGKNGKPDGTGVGLTNVCQRIDARFGSAAKCEFGPTADGGYRVLMTLPLDRADG